MAPGEAHPGGRGRKAGGRLPELRALSVSGAEGACSNFSCCPALLRRRQVGYRSPGYHSAPSGDPTPMLDRSSEKSHLLRSLDRCSHSLPTPLPFEPLGWKVRGQVGPDRPSQESSPSPEQQGTREEGQEWRPPPPVRSSSLYPPRMGSQQPTRQQCCQLDYLSQSPSPRSP